MATMHDAERLLDNMLIKVANLVEDNKNIIKSLPHDVQLIVEGVKGVQVAQLKLHNKFRLECLELEKKYLGLQKPLYERRQEMIAGKVRPTKRELKAGEDYSKEDDNDYSSPPKDIQHSKDGIPSFWLAALRNHVDFNALITKRDEDALQYLADVRLEYLTDGLGFQILFQFQPNTYFKDDVLVKTYQLEGEVGFSGDLRYVDSYGSNITWNHGMSLTEGGAADSPKSFFKFFDPPKMPSYEEMSAVPDETLNGIEEKIEEDYQLGAILKDQIIPRAVDWYTGKFLSDLDETDTDIQPHSDGDPSQPHVSLKPPPSSSGGNLFAKNVRDARALKKNDKQSKGPSASGTASTPQGQVVSFAALSKNLAQLSNNPDVHQELWDYLRALNNIEDQAERNRLRHETFETCLQVLPKMVYTKGGCRVTRELIALGATKDRKQILKVLRPHVKEMCLDDEAQLALFAALDIIDDTMRTIKYLIWNMVAAADELYTSPQGRCSLIYLLAPRTWRHFTPARLASLAETDETRSRTSKKDPSKRENEIRGYASASLLSWVEAGASQLVRDPGASLLVEEVMLYSDGDKTAAQMTLLGAISGQYPSPDRGSPHPIDLPHVERLYKTLLQGGQLNRAETQVEHAPGWDRTNFAVAFIEHVGKDVTVAMCTLGNCSGALVIAELCEALIASERRKERGLLKGWFNRGVKRMVQDGHAKGKDALLESLRRLF